MNVLALETSVKTGSLAVWHANQLAYQAELPSAEKTATSLFVGIEQGLREAGVTAGEIDLIAVSTGPGSFTGLRIGITLTKTFAYAAGSQIAAVPTPLSLAYGALCGKSEGLQPRSVEVVIDAQRQQVFVQSFQLNEQNWPIPLTPIEIVPRVDWWSRPHACDCLTGPGLSVLEKTALAETPAAPTVTAAFAALPPCLASQRRQPNAVDIGYVGLEMVAANQTTSLWELQPEYGRQSAAEEKAKRPR